MLVNEQAQKWRQIISEELGVKDARKLDWMSKMAQVHELKEALQQNPNISGGVYSTPLNTLGIGNPMMPLGVGYNATNGSGIGDTGKDFHQYNYGVGSGDIPMSTLTMALEVAAQTVGFDLVGVVPATGPWAMLQYLDFPYAGGKVMRPNETMLDGKGDGAENKPIYIKVKASLDDLKTFYDANEDLSQEDDLEFVNTNNASLKAKYIGKSRIDGAIVVRVVECKSGDENCSIADVMLTDVTVGGVTLKAPQADLVATAADHVQGFSNFFGNGETGENYSESNDPMTRAQNETGVGNTIGARMFTKMIQMGSYEVTGTVTRQQLQDMPLYGIDVIGKVLETMQMELSQAINNRILDRVFKLGVTNAANQKMIQNLDLNLYFAGAADPSTKELKDFSAASKFIGIDGENKAENWGEIRNATQNTSAENIYTHQRRISTRILAARNMINVISRWGAADWVVTNAQILTALQDCAQFIINPMVTDLTQDTSRSIYYAGSLAGLQVYVDPYMTWEDTRVCVGRRSNGENPGVVFMPYILCDTVQTIVEGTMAPKLLVNSRFALCDCGFHPEQSFLTFLIDSGNGFII